MTKNNILEIISSLEDEIEDLQIGLIFVQSKKIREVVNREICDMQDNLYRYKLQARAWKLID